MTTPLPTTTAKEVDTTVAMLTALLGRHPTIPEMDMWAWMDEGQREALTDLYSNRK